MHRYTFHQLPLMIKWLFAGVSWRFYYHMQVVYHELLCLVVADHGIHTFCGPYSNSICPRTNFARPWVWLWTTPLVQMVKQHFPSFLCPIFCLLFHPVGTVILVNLHLLDGFGKLQVKSPLTCSMCGFFLPCGRFLKPVFIKSPGHRSSHPFSQILPQEVGTHPEDLLWLVARGGHGENRCVIRAFLECPITVAILNYWR